MSLKQVGPVLSRFSRISVVHVHHLFMLGNDYKKGIFNGKISLWPKGCGIDLRQKSNNRLCSEPLVSMT